MALQCGIVGLPNVGKSTLFNCLSNAKAQAANFPFCTIEPNVGVITVPDRRLIRLAEIDNPKRVVPTTIEIVDIAGLVKGASKGEGLGNKFLGNIRNTNAIIHVLRCFDNGNITHVDGSIDPVRDKGIIDTELQLKDLETVENRLSKTQKQATSGGDKQAKRVKERLVGERSETEMREYVEDCFGVSMYAPGELKRIEERLCSGAHWDSILHFTRGELAPLERNNREAIVQRSSAKRQSGQNRKYFTDDIVRNRLTISRLAEKIRNCMLVHLDDARIKARAGSLAPEKVWRAVTLGDESVFTRPERGNDTELSVDILLDASASQIERQESVSTQAYMIAESLTRCGIPTRVYSFCTLNGCTVLRLYRDYEETNKNEAIFDYCAAGWNRDGLAFRAAGWMMRSSHCERRLLMILSDASPNDDRKLLVQETGKQELYRGQPGVLDSAAEVEKLRREGISVMCIFTGEDADLPSARRIYGRDLVRIRSIEQFADAVGGVVVQLIGNM